MNNAITPIRRNLSFHLPKEEISRWNNQHLHISHFYNTLSIFFPVGERFFIDSVRNYRNQITDPELKASVTAFIGQEAMHGREHDEYNDAMAEAGLPVKKMESKVTWFLGFLQRILPHSLQLAVTVALEHLTAILADTLLRDPDLLKNAHPRYAAIWQWHALEETEHKAVAFDVYTQVVGKGIKAYFHRTFALTMATIIFWMLFYAFYIQVIRKEGGLWDFKGWAASFSFQWLKPGVLRRVIPEWLEFYRPSFHPWDQDNRQYLERIDDLVTQVDGFSATAH